MSLRNARSKRLFDIVGALGGLYCFRPSWRRSRARSAGRRRPGSVPPGAAGRRAADFDHSQIPLDEGRARDTRRQTAAGDRLDELPQFLNILRGDMSAVGPRPLTASDVRRLEWAAPRFDCRWRVRPGLTGLAQLDRPAVGTRLSEHGSMVCGASKSVARRQARGALFRGECSREDSHLTVRLASSARTEDRMKVIRAEHLAACALASATRSRWR